VNPPNSFDKRMPPRQPRALLTYLPLALLALAVLLFAVYFSQRTILRYHAYEARALDMGNLNQAIWNTAHGDWFRMTNQEVGLTNRLSYHVEPIILLIAPFYRLFPSVEFLLILQASVAALGALPLFVLARRQRLGDWMGLVFAVAYLLNPALQGAVWYEFHPVTLAPTFLMAAFYFLVTGRTGWFAFFAALAAGCKEEIGLLVGMLGVYAFFALRRRRLGTLTVLLGFGWSLLAVLGIQTAFAGGNIHWGRYDYLGGATTDKVRSLLTRPDLVLGKLQQTPVLRYFFQLLLPVGFTALLAPEVFFLALPSLAINLLADFSPMHEATRLIYVAPVLPFVMLAMVMGVARAGAWTGARGEGRGATVAEDPRQSENSATQRRKGAKAQSKAEPTKNPRKSAASAKSAVYPLSALAILTGALASQWLYGYLPGMPQYLSLEVTDHHRAAQAIIDQIPPDAKVSAHDRLNPHVSGRSTLYIFPRLDDADTVFLDVSGAAWPQHPSDLRRTVDDLLANGFGVAAASDGYLLLRQGAPDKTLPAAFFTAWQPTAAVTTTTQPLAVFGDELALLDYTVGTDRYGELVVTFIWQALKPLTRDLRFQVSYRDRGLNVLHDSEFYPSTAELWYPTSLWPAGAPVQMQTLPWTLDAEQMALAVGVYAGDNWHDGQRLPVTSHDANLPLLEDGTLLRLGGYARTAGGDWTPLAPDAMQGGAASLAVRFGDAIELTGASLPATARAGEPARLTLLWRALQPVTRDYNAFVHLLDANGNRVAQVDWAPGDAISRLPTSQWPVGVTLADTQQLPLPPDLPPGVYTLIAGLYDWQSGERLGDAVEVGVIEVMR
jgi:uncharacterized membrane protein